MNMHKTVRDFIYETFMHGSPPLDFHTFFIEFLSEDEKARPHLFDRVFP